MSKKTYVLDTNVLLSDPDCLNSFQEHDLIIPMAVLEELDRHKSRSDEVGRNARQISRSLDDLRAKGSLFKGVKLPPGGTLKIVSISTSALEQLPVELRESKVDNLIIAFMLSFKGSEHILVSKDINVRLKCDSLEIKCEDYRKARVVSNMQQMYRGVEVVEVEKDEVDEFYTNESHEILDSTFHGVKLYPNQIVVIKSVVGDKTTSSAITRYDEATKCLLPIQKVDQVFGLKPRNKEQSFSLDLLFNPDIRLITMTGAAGCGKTLLALAAALEQTKGIGGAKATYNKLVVTRPIQPVGKELGFLPGTLEEKMEPWIAPIRDNFNFLIGSKKNFRVRKQNQHSSYDQKRSGRDDGSYLSLLQEKGLIEIEAITFIRGRSIPDSFIIIDEAQNLSVHELKTIITRVGDGTKIVLTGDLEQIDNVHVDAFSNGLSYAIEKFKDYSIAAHVTLLKGERSELATLASQIL